MLTAPLLEGPLVRLEPLTPAAVPELGEAGATADRSTFTYTAVPDGPASAESYVERILAEHDAGRSVPFVVRDTASGELVGCTRFLDLEVFPAPGAGTYGATGPAPDDDHPPTVGEIGGTWYLPRFQGTGVNAAAKLLLLGHAFETWSMLRVCLKTDARNKRSRRAIAGIGATFEGVRRVHMPAADGGVRDSAFFSVVASEWAGVKARLEARVGEVGR